MKKIAYFNVESGGAYVPKGQPLSSSRVDELLDLAYATRGIQVIVTGDGLKNEADGWFVGFDDDNPDRFDWFWCFKNTSYGRKVIVIGHTGEPAAKNELLTFMKGEFTNQSKHYYIEASHGVDALMRKWGIPLVPSSLVGKILNKSIKPVDEFSYEREISSAGLVKKTMYGYPSISKEAGCWSNPLLHSKVGGFMDNQGDLDAYDSEIAHDLYELHDQIMQNPMREAHGYSEYYQQRGFDFTYKALKGRLIPAVKAAANGDREVSRLLTKANAELAKAAQLGKVRDWNEGAKFLEQAFSYTHNAIDVIRKATRNVPAVRSLRPVMGGMEKQAWQVGESIQNGQRVYVYVWMDSPRGVVVSDEHNWHADLVHDLDVDEEDFNEYYNRYSRGLVILYPQTKTGDVLMYEGSSHDDAGFIPSDIWKEIQSEFKGYQLEEKQGLNEAYVSGPEKTRGLPIPKNKTFVHASKEVK